MAKIASVLYDYQSKKKLFYVSILTSPTTSEVTSSHGMLGDIIIIEPNSYIAFASKRVIERLENMIRGAIGGAIRHKLISTPHNLVTSTPLTTTYESFFGLHPLSQVLDQTNPLTQIVHGRKLSYESAFLSILTF